MNEGGCPLSESASLPAPTERNEGSNAVLKGGMTDTSLSAEDTPITSPNRISNASAPAFASTTQASETLTTHNPQTSVLPVISSAPHQTDSARGVSNGPDVTAPEAARTSPRPLPGSVVFIDLSTPPPDPASPFTVKAGYTPLQLKTLRDQIFAFKSLKKNELSLELFLVAHGGNTSKARAAFASHTNHLQKPVHLGVATNMSPASSKAGLIVAPRGSILSSQSSSYAMKDSSPVAGKTPGPGPSRRAHAQAQAQATRDAREAATMKEAARTKLIAKYQRLGLYDATPMSLPQSAMHPTAQIQAGGIALQPQDIKTDVMKLLAKEGDRLLDVRLKARERELTERLACTQTPLRGQPRSAAQIELRKLRLRDTQRALRARVEAVQSHIMSLGERAYRKLSRECDKWRDDIEKQAAKEKRVAWEAHLKSIGSWKHKFREFGWATKNRRDETNKKVQRLHQRMASDFGRKKDERMSARMEALRANDMDAYYEMLAEASKSAPQESEKKYEQLTSFLSKTEEYLNSLASKISVVKFQQERESEATAGLTGEELQEEADRHLQDHMEHKKSRGKPNYYDMAHSIGEVIDQQPRMLRAGKLREYQLVGLQWMISLYNNRLNGILADEMGLGKTVQVMALIAYLLESKNNMGPHLIIVPNAVVVNWKSEIKTWLPNITPVYYLGSKDVRARIFATEVMNMKFNVLVTTYEFIMRDRAKLSKVDWKYCIIDEAQRMKDRESRLSRDLDRFRCERRLLLTGTPLQNDLLELWALLNLLLPQVFDSKATFNDWFGSTNAKDKSGAGAAGEEAEDWLETEKRVIVISRLHQILEPFMLRRMVEDVESRLPPKVAMTLRVPFSALQSSVYEWVRRTGTLRIDPSGLVRGKQRKHNLPYAPLNNKVMELRKLCNHVLLSYPHLTLKGGFSEEMITCTGKFWALDQILVKLFHTPHRVLLFSTMTRLLDLVEQYLQWRVVGGARKGGEKMGFCRIDGCTPLEQREEAINAYNAPGSDKFVFLLSIRAAGRGLNLQSSDTVIIYDPDPNPKNEEQAIARSHRIGQKRNVRVFHLESVADTFFSQGLPEEDVVDEVDQDKTMGAWGGAERTYVESIETLVRNNIQKVKQDMAEEVIDAGRFDQQTTQEERRVTLEKLLHTQQENRHVQMVPTLAELNRMLARDERELELFESLDEELEWAHRLAAPAAIPSWMRYDQVEMCQAEEMSGKTLEGDSKGRKKKAVGMTSTDIALMTETLGRGMRSRGTPGTETPASLEDTVDEAEFMMEDEEDDVTNVDAEGDDDVEENDTAEDNWLDEEDDEANGEDVSAVPSRSPGRSGGWEDDVASSGAGPATRVPQPEEGEATPQRGGLQARALAGGGGGDQEDEDEATEVDDDDDNNDNDEEATEDEMGWEEMRSAPRRAQVPGYPPSMAPRAEVVGNNDDDEATEDELTQDEATEEDEEATQDEAGTQDEEATEDEATEEEMEYGTAGRAANPAQARRGLLGNARKAAAFGNSSQKRIREQGRDTNRGRGAAYVASNAFSTRGAPTAAAGQANRRIRIQTGGAAGRSSREAPASYRAAASTPTPSKVTRLRVVNRSSLSAQAGRSTAQEDGANPPSKRVRRH